MPRSVLTLIGLVVLAMVVAACGDQPPPTDGGESPAAESPGESAPATESAAPTEEPPAEGDTILATVQARGTLICGVNGSLAGFSFLEEDGTTTGFDADFCRAIAAAVLGDPEAVEYRNLATDERGPALQTGEVDVLIRNTTWTVTRDTSWGLFGPTTFYDGQAIMVNSTAVDATELADLDGATICVQSGTTTELNLNDSFTTLGLAFTPQVFADIDLTYGAYEEGRCDAVTSDRSQLVSRRTAFANPDDHVILDAVMSKEPLGPVVPLGDDQWFNIVKWVVYATITAEELGITQANVEDTAATTEDLVIQRLLGVPFSPAEGEPVEPFDAGLGLEPEWVVNVISAVGNYGEIYDRNLGAGTPFDLARGLNSLWNADPPGLLYAPPYR